MIENVVFIGAGNLATQLALAMTDKGISVKQIYSRTLEAAKELAVKVNADFTDDLSNLIPESDLYIVSVKDSAIEEVLRNLSLDKNQLIVHTAGSIPMEVLNRSTNNYGVFYPIQSFSKYKNIDFSDIPICIEASHASTLLKLQELAQRLSSSVQQINSEERKTLHLAAVFVNNFVNHFYAVGAEILQDKKLDFNLLKPLIRETAEKIECMTPIEAQTGPARRNDQSVINEQLKMLQDQPEFHKIYSFVSQSIYHIHLKQKHDLL
jgi:predicted short-subunit dehydrogenase-like oxidoreductase (DUF2520 family)